MPADRMPAGWTPIRMVHTRALPEADFNIAIALQSGGGDSGLIYYDLYPEGVGPDPAGFAAAKPDPVVADVDAAAP